MASHPKNSDLDRLLDDATAGSAGDCPDENVLSAVAEGRLDPAERERLAGHLAGCAACADVARTLGAWVESNRPAGRLLRFPRRLAAAAAVLLLGVGAWFFLSSRGSGDGAGTADRLAASAARLAREAPDAFGDFRPLAVGELRARGADALRGDSFTVSPAGRVVSPRPTFRWDAVPGARRYVVTLLGPEGVRWKRETSATELAWPDDAPALERGARAVWTLSADDPHATGAERAIQVVEETEAVRWEAARKAAEGVPEPLRALLLAHLALRRDLPAEAEEQALRFREASPDDPLGTATLAAARERLAAR